MSNPRILALALFASGVLGFGGCASSTSSIDISTGSVDDGVEIVDDTPVDGQTDTSADRDPSASETTSTAVPAAEELSNQRSIRPAPEPRVFQSRGDLRRTTGFALATVAELPGALAMAVRSGSDSLFVALQPGFVVELQPAGGGAYEPRQDLILDVSESTRSNAERGLLGIAFSPDGGFLYAVWTDVETGANQLVEFAMTDDGRVAPGSERLLLEVPQPARNHNGGQIAFGPDGYLYYGLGDGGSSGDFFDQGQDPSTLLGTVLRIDPTPQNGRAYGIPSDNPYASGGPGAPEVWIYGLRNPWRFSFDSVTGDLWIADVGQDAREEVNVLWAGENYAGVNLGWPIMEGTASFDGPDDPAFLAPIFDYGHNDGACSVTGGYVYRGESLTALQGTYVFGDYCSGAIMALNAQGDNLLVGSLGLPNHRKNTLGSFGEGPDGELYVLSLTGDISRIESLR